MGIVNWRIVHLGVGPTSEDDFDANYMGAHFAVKAILWDGKDGDDSEDALYRILLRKTPDGLLEAVGVQWFVDFVGSEPLWGDCDPGSAYRLLFAIEEIKKLMVAAQKTNSLEVKKLGK